MFDVRTYMQKKEKGLVKIRKFQNKFMIFYRRFDPETGDELEPQVATVTKDSVEAAIADLQGQIDNLKMLLSDLEEAEEL